MTDPLAPLKPRKYKPGTAEVLRRLLAAGPIDDLWLPFPQWTCCFAFGPNRKAPLPVGALFLLWGAGTPWVQDCPECGGQAYMISFGGLLNMGGGRLVCTGCGLDLYQPLGGLGTVSQILDRSPIAGTPFRHTGMRFGGAYPSDGAQRRAQLGVELPLDAKTPEDEVSFSINTGAGKKTRLHIDLAAASRTERQAGKPTPTSKNPRGKSVTAARSATTGSNCMIRKLMAKGLTRKQAATWISIYFM